MNWREQTEELPSITLAVPLAEMESPLEMEITKRMVAIAFREWHLERFGCEPPDEYREFTDGEWHGVPRWVGEMRRGRDRSSDAEFPNADDGGSDFEPFSFQSNP